MGKLQESKQEAIQAKIDAGITFDNLSKKEQKIYEKYFSGSLDNMKDIETEVTTTQTEKELEKAQKIIEQNSTNPATEEDTIPDYSNSNNSNDNTNDKRIINNNEESKITNKETYMTNTIDTQLLTLETEIKELKKQLNAIGRHSNKIDKKYLKSIREILIKAKRQQIDVNQRYSRWIDRKGFEDIRSAEDITIMLNDIESKISFAKTAGSAVLTGKTTKSRERQGQITVVNNSKECKRIGSIDYSVPINEDDNTKTALMKTIHNSQLLESVGPRGGALLKTVSKLAVAGFGLFTIYKTIKNAIKGEWKSAAAWGTGALIFYGASPKKVLDMMGVEANNIFGGLKGLKGKGGSNNSGSNISVQDNYNAITNTSKEDLTGEHAKEKKDDIKLHGSMLVATPFCDMTLSEINQIVQCNGNGIVAVDYAKARAFLNTKYGSGGGRFINALNLLEESDQHAKGLGINIIKEGFNQRGIDQSALVNPQLANNKLIERVSDMGTTINASSELMKFYGLKGNLEKNPKIKSYFESHPGSFDKFTNQILDLPEETRNAILNGDVKFGILNEDGKDYLALEYKGIDFYLGLTDTVTTNNTDHRNQIGVKNKDGKVVFFDRRFPNDKSMIQAAYCLGDILNKIRGNIKTTTVLKPRGGRKGLIRKQLVTDDGKPIIDIDKLPNEMKDSYMPDLTQFLNEDLGSRVSKNYEDIHGISNQLTNSGFKPERMISQVSSLVNQVAIDNLIGGNISVEYAPHPDDPTRNVLYINTFGEHNNTFLDINTNNPDTSIIKVGFKYATTPGHTLPYTFTEGDVNANGGLKGAMGLALLIGQCSAVKGTHHSSDPSPWHRFGDQLEYSYGDMSRSTYRGATGLPTDKFSQMFDEKKSSIALKNWIPSIFDPTIFSKSANGNKTSLTDFLNGCKIKDKNAQGQEILKSYWNEDERVRAEFFVDQMQEAMARTGILSWPTDLDPSDISAYKTNNIQTDTTYIRPLNKTDYAGLETYEMIRVSKNTDGTYRYNHVYFQPSDKQVGSLGLPLFTDMNTFLKGTESYLTMKSGTLANKFANGTEKVITTIGSDASKATVRIYKDARSIVSTGYNDISDVVSTGHEDIKYTVGVTYEQAKKGINTLYNDLVITGIPLVYNSAATISQDAINLIMFAWEKVGGVTITKEGKKELNAVKTLGDLNQYLIDKTGINLSQTVKAITTDLESIYTTGKGDLKGIHDRIGPVILAILNAGVNKVKEWTGVVKDKVKDSIDAPENAITVEELRSLQAKGEFNGYFGGAIEATEDGQPILNTLRNDLESAQQDGKDKKIKYITYDKKNNILGIIPIDNLVYSKTKEKVYPEQRELKESNKIDSKILGKKYDLDA